MQLIYHERLDSTNRQAKELVQQGILPGTVIQAGQQSAGRGQYDRSFLSPPGGLYFSLILNPALLPQEIAMMTLAAGLGCRDALREQCGLGVHIKWPNDLYCSGKKIAGILSEYCMPISAEAKAAVVIGVGLNVNSRTSDFPPELYEIISTVRDCSGAVQNMAALLWAAVADINRRVDQLLAERATFLAQWQEADYLSGRRIQHLLRDTTLGTGIGLGIDERGRYLFRQDDGQVRTVLGGQLRLL